MACNRHKKKEGGRVVPVFRGLARDVQTALARSGVASADFRHLCKHNGRSKVRIEQPGQEHFVVTICDNEHGKSMLTVRTREPAAVAQALRTELTRMGVTIA